jgi:rhodanese-related sulfurtransferase
MERKKIMLSQLSVEEIKIAMIGPRPPKLIDIREPEEFERGHLREAELIPLTSLAEKIEQKHPNKHEAIAVYDDIGIRSQDAARLLRALGYSDVNEVIGGYAGAWAM